MADEAILLNLKTGRYYGLDSVGSAFVAALEGSEHLDAAVEALRRSYDVEREQLRSHLNDLCEALSERGLIEFEPDDGP